MDAGHGFGGWDGGSAIDESRTWRIAALTEALLSGLPAFFRCLARLTCRLFATKSEHCSPRWPVHAACQVCLVSA